MGSDKSVLPFRSSLYVPAIYIKTSCNISHTCTAYHDSEYCSSQNSEKETFRFTGCQQVLMYSTNVVYHPPRTLKRNPFPLRLASRPVTYGTAISGRPLLDGAHAGALEHVCLAEAQIPRQSSASRTVILNEGHHGSRSQRLLG